MAYTADIFLLTAWCLKSSNVGHTRILNYFSMYKISDLGGGGSMQISMYGRSDLGGFKDECQCTKDLI